MILDPLYAFVFAGLFSPGPNVILVTSSGARFGLRRTVPHIAGIVVGVGVTSGLTALGVGALLMSMPGLTFALRLAAAGWILWMAWVLFMSTRRPQVAARARPMRFHEAVLFQWVNPKVWAIALAAASGYAAGLPPLQEAARLAGTLGSTRRSKNAKKRDTGKAFRGVASQSSRDALRGKPSPPTPREMPP